MRFYFVILAATLLCGCGGKKDLRVTVVKPDDVATPDMPLKPLELVRAADGASHLVMVNHGTGRFIIAELSDDGTKIGDEIDSGTEIIKRGDLFYAPVFAAADSESWLYARRDSKDQFPQWHVFRHKYGDATHFQEFPLNLEKITALHLEQDHLFIGAGPIVGTANLRATSPTFSAIKDRSTHQYKAYDLFARDEGLLVAIDDEVSPMFAELLELDSTGAHTLVSNWELPGIVNGHYDTALLQVDDPATKSGTLYVTASFSILSGTGRLLAALPIKNGTSMHDSDITLNSGAQRSDPRIVEEFLSRGDPKAKSNLLAGTVSTWWTGIAKVQSSTTLVSIAIAAGTRGLLTVPSDFSATSKATEIDVGGNCLDVMNVDERLFALVINDGKGWLLELELKGENLSIKTRSALPQVYDRFVR